MNNNGSQSKISNIRFGVNIFRNTIDSNINNIGIGGNILISNLTIIHKKVCK